MSITQELQIPSGGEERKVFVCLLVDYFSMLSAGQTTHH
jgi:hypothetical protein